MNTEYEDVGEKTVTFSGFLKVIGLFVVLGVLAGVAIVPLAREQFDTEQENIRRIAVIIKDPLQRTQVVNAIALNVPNVAVDGWADCNSFDTFVLVDSRQKYQYKLAVVDEFTLPCGGGR